MMPDYSYYYPMPYADALRLSQLEAQQYALERMCGLMRDDVARAAWTADEQAALQTLLSAARKRVSAGLAEYEVYKRREPVMAGIGELAL